MPIIQFKGRTFPQSVHIAITLPPIHWEDEETGLIMDFAVEVKDGTVHILCTVNKFIHGEHINAIYNRAFDIVRTGVDLVSFASGRPFTIILERLVDPTGFERPFGLFEPELGQLCNSLKPGPEYNQILSIIIAEWPLSIALRDLIEAISIPHRCAVNCGRVVDTLRVQSLENTDDPSKGWESLRSNLNLSRVYLQYITDASKGPRHGDHKGIVGSTMKEVTIRTWIIVDRFFEFRKRENKPLPLSEFPLL